LENGSMLEKPFSFYFATSAIKTLLHCEENGRKPPTVEENNNWKNF
jgi:hypothetical protein